MRLPENYYDSLEAPYSGAHALQLLQTLMPDDALQITSCLFLNGSSAEESFRFPQLLQAAADKNVRALVIPCAISNPVDYPHANHSSALYIDLEKREIHYQDPYGLPMPIPLYENLTHHFATFSIYNHHAEQQIEDDFSCAAITIDNLLRFSQGLFPENAPDILAIRRGQLPALQTIIVAENAAAAARAALDTEPQQQPRRLLKVKSTYAPSADELAAMRAAYWAFPYPHIEPKTIGPITRPPTIYMPPHRPIKKLSPAPSLANADTAPGS